MTAKDPNEAVANANRYTSYDVGMCLKWVRSPCWEIPSLFGSAIEAWNGAKFKHPGDRNPPKGAPCFYRGGSYGHIVISDGNGIRSTDCQSSGRVSHTDLAWPERAWGDTYLGWTEDLNGVKLPLGSSGQGNGGDDDVPKYDHASTKTAQKIKPNEWQAIKWTAANGDGAFSAGDVSAGLGGRTYSAVLHVTLDAPKGATIRVQCVEYDSGTLEETDPQTEIVATGGSTYGEQNQNGYVAKGRRLRWRITCTEAATLTHADVVTLSW